MSMTAGEARAISLKEALGAHIQADAYRDSFPDDDRDVEHNRKQETWWRLKARQWISNAVERECAERAKARAVGEKELLAVSADTQDVFLNGRLVTLSGVALEVMRTMTASEHKAASDAFNRGYRGGLGFAIGVCDEHQATVDHIKSRCVAARDSK